jgi:hypothetical protein
LSGLCKYELTSSAEIPMFVSNVETLHTLVYC